MPIPSKFSASDLALCRSALYEALALGIMPPTDETVARLVAPEGVAALADAAAVLDEEAEGGLAAGVRRLADAPGLDGLAAAYQRLFGHTARGAVPPYETEYGADALFQPIHEMSDLVAFYRAFGLRLRAEAHERPDHVACECEFLAFLARKEAYARDRDDAVMLAATEGAARRFLRDHLGRWAPAFGGLLARRDPDGFFGALGALCVEFVGGECRRLGVPAGPDVLRLRSTALPAVPAACGEP
ncbi:MAG: molecular chaperone TorD family protein [Candidatus Rokubacteria bacterium]|nr:molecular chaperone TorD family protein [Candidatus Rokubacteria bacterium]